MQIACSEFVARNGPLKPGSVSVVADERSRLAPLVFLFPHSFLSLCTQACLTHAGELPFLSVIHVVGLQCSNLHDTAALSRCDAALSNCIGNALGIADRQNLNSVAFPAIGTGNNLYPIPRCVNIHPRLGLLIHVCHGVCCCSVVSSCAEQSLKAVVNFFRNRPNSATRTVRFVLYTEETLDAFCNEVRRSTARCFVLLFRSLSHWLYFLHPSSTFKLVRSRPNITSCRRRCWKNTIQRHSDSRRSGDMRMS